MQEKKLREMSSGELYSNMKLDLDNAVDDIREIQRLTQRIKRKRDWMRSLL